MIINSIEKDIVYIDPQKAYTDNAVEGDGSSPSSPLFSFPSTLRDDAIYLVNKTFAYEPAVIGPITDSTTKSLTIWGMPDDNDPLFALLPAEAKEAWGGENGSENNRAVVYFKRSSDNSNSHSVKFTALRNLEIRGIVFLESYSYMEHSNSNYALVVNNSSVPCNVFIDNVLFTSGIVQMSGNKVIDVKDYAASTGNDFSYRGGRWICANNDSSAKIAHSSIVKNCTFEYASCNADGVRLGYAYNHFIDNCNINIRGRQASAVSCISIKGSTADKRKRCIAKVTNCTITLDFRRQNEAVSGYSSANQFGRAIIVEDMETYMSGITAAFAETPSYTLEENKAISFTTSLIYARVFTGSRIESINANFGDWADLVQTNVIDICVDSDGGSNDDSQSFNKGGQYTIVKNITIATSATAVSGSTHQYAGRSGDDEEEHYGYTNIMTTGAYAGDNYALKVYKNRTSTRVRCSDDILLQNIVLTCFRGSALFARGCMLDMNSNTIKGLVNLEGCVGKIGSIETYAIQKALRDSGYNLIYVGNITCNISGTPAPNTGEPAIDIINYTSNILVTNSNVKCYTNNINDNSNECIYICTNNKTQGNYTCRNGVTFCNTWSTYRTGSASHCSLKLENNESDKNAPLRIGGTPFKGITVHADQGNKIAKLYVTTHGYLNPSEIKDHLNIRIKKEDGSIVTDVEGSWEPDENSQWNQLENGTAFVLSVPISIANDNGEDLEFEYSFNWAFVDAAVFVDPYPEIVAAS